MKKVLVIVMAMLFVLSAVLLVACDVNEVSITLKDVPETVSFGSTIDYSKISIEVEYDNGKKETVKLTANGVTHNEINTYQATTQTLSVQYKGLTAQEDIQVLFDIDPEKVTVLNVRQTEGYREYNVAKNVTEHESEFYNKDALYTVGNDNGYVMLPDVTWRYNDRTMPASLSIVETTFVLSVQNGNNGWDVVDKALLGDYLRKEVVDNVYYFNDNAVGKTFKLDVTLSDDYAFASATVPNSISQVFQVVKGYNVYDAWGLSVLDNKNVKSWADIKQRVLAWDEGKALSQFADVEQVILHNNIEVTVDYLPDNYFWHKGDEAKREGSMSFNAAEQLVPTTLKEYLPGSLKEAWLGEDWEKSDSDTEQRGLYVSNGIGLSGNYLKLSYKSNLDAADKGSKGIYIVHDYKQTTSATTKQYPESHYSFMVYTHADPKLSNEESEALIKGTRTIENVYFKGETQKTDDVSSPAGLMMISADISGLTLVNTIGTQWFCNAQLDGVGMGSLTMKDCKFYESFSQMVFCWGIPQIDITHCEMKRAGGPLFIIQTRTGKGADGTNRNSVVNIDDTSNMESWLAGAETWFDINDLPAATIETLFDYGTKSDGVANTNYKKDGKVNVIAVVIPDPGDVFKNQNAIPGTINIGETTYSMKDSVFYTMANLTDIAAKGATLADTTNQALGGSNAQLAQLQAGFTQLAGATGSLKVAPVYQCGNTYGYFDGTALVHLETPAKSPIATSVKSLYQGAVAVAAQVQGTPLESQWNELVAELAPIGTLTVDTDAWSTSWTAGHLAFWVNPGGLNPSKPDLTLKHFMVLFGEAA